MSVAPAVPSSLPLSEASSGTRWLVLVAASLLLGGGLQWAGLPAALLLGPLAAAVLLQTSGGTVAVPRSAMAAAQAVIGCLVARAITPAILVGFAAHWPVFLSVIGASVGQAPRSAGP